MQQSLSNQFVRQVGITLIVLFTILCAVCIIIPKGNEVLWVNGNYSDFQDLFFSLVTLVGEASVFVLLAIVIAFIRFNYAILFALVFVLNSTLVLFFKRVVFPDMLRPSAWLDHSLLHFVDGAEVESLYSFPSGHTATAFAMAIILTLCLKHKGWSVLFFTLALLVGYSRIYLLQHHLMDILAGAFIGTSSAFIIYNMKHIATVQWFYKQLQTKFDTNRMVTLLPPFIVNSSIVRRWTQRVLSEAQ